MQPGGWLQSVHISFPLMVSNFHPAQSLIEPAIQHKRRFHTFFFEFGIRAHNAALYACAATSKNDFVAGTRQKYRVHRGQREMRARILILFFLLVNLATCGDCFRTSRLSFICRGHGYWTFWGVVLINGIWLLRGRQISIWHSWLIGTLALYKFPAEEGHFLIDLHLWSVDGRNIKDTRYKTYHQARVGTMVQGLSF